MTDARTAREALIVEALRGVDAVLAAADSAGERLAINTQRLESAAAALTTAGTTYSAEVAQLTDATKKALADYIERRVGHDEASLGRPPKGNARSGDAGVCRSARTGGA